MLCAFCHTIVDKAPEAYPDEKVLGWKRNHASKLKALFGVVEFSSREAAWEAVEPILSQNHAIFDQYGPNIEAAENPESGAPERWKRKMLTRILPNNSRVLALLDANRKLLRKEELETLELFRQHLDDLQAYHIEGLRSDASRFPAAMTSILAN